MLAINQPSSFLTDETRSPSPLSISEMSPRGSKMIKVCMNCTFSFRSEMNTLGEFCSKGKHFFCCFGDIFLKIGVTFFLDCKTSYLWFKKSPMVHSEVGVAPMLHVESPSSDDFRPVQRSTSDVTDQKSISLLKEEERCGESPLCENSSSDGKHRYHSKKKAMREFLVTLKTLFKG